LSRASGKWVSAKTAKSIINFNIKYINLIESFT
jgi:hypothetical protein